MALYKCGVCGYISEYETDKCPKCGSPKASFTKLDSEKEALILKARKTNEMHFAIASMEKKIQKWARKIKEENLDPNCVAIADRVIKDTTETIQSIKAEVQGHVGKGKWG